jgi:AraC-like DNA-binding protein
MRAISAEAAVIGWPTPIGSYVVAEAWVAWCWDATLCGSVFWGRPTERQVRDFLVFGERMLQHPDMAPRFDIITDGGFMEGAEPRAFAALAGYAAERLSTLTRRVRRHVIVPPPGLVGAATVGIFPLLNAVTSVSQLVAKDARAACALMDTAAARACAPELVALTDELTGGAPVLRLLKRYFSANFATASVERAARALGLATRSLQRQLSAAQTTFRDELERARIDEARRRLTETDDKLEAIADALGFSSPSHFGLRFRAVTGELPSDYRTLNRASDATVGPDRTRSSAD